MYGDVLNLHVPCSRCYSKISVSDVIRYNEPIFVDNMVFIDLLGSVPFRSAWIGFDSIDPLVSISTTIPYDRPRLPVRSSWPPAGVAISESLAGSVGILARSLRYPLICLFSSFFRWISVGSASSILTRADQRKKNEKK